MIRILIQMLVGLLLLLTFRVAQSQAVARVSGQIVHPSGKPVAGATINIKGREGQYTHTLLSDSSGQFHLTLAPGNYTLTVTAIYLTTQQKEISIGATPLSLAPMVMVAADAKELNAVVIKAEKQMIEQKIDRTVINVGAMIGGSAGNALQLLEKTPGVIVEGNAVSLSGRGSATVIIDNRPTQMSEGDLANYLKSIPSNTVEKIELIPVPPSSYEASGSAMINIVLKKNKLRGLSGSVNTGGNAGRYVRGFGNISLNYNYKQLRVMGNISYNHDVWFSEANTKRLFFDDNGITQTTIRQRHFTKSGFNSVSGRLGVDYDLSKSTSIGFIINLQHSPGWDRMVYTSESDQQDIHVYNGNGHSRQSNLSKNQSFNIHALHKFKKEGSELRFDANHMEYDRRSNSLLRKLTSIDDLTYQYDIPTNISVYNAQVDYTWSAKENWGLETGLRSSNVSTDNTFQMYEKDQQNNTLDDFNNNFRYREWVNAGYVSVQKKFNRLNTKLGIRGEQTHIHGTNPALSTEGNGFSRSYFSAFPSGFFSYRLDSAGKKNLTLSVSRRINRPGFQQLNPFLVKEDDYNFSGGNPLLRPEFNTQTDLRYQHGNKWTFNAVYAGFRQIIFKSLRVEDTVFIQQPENIATGIATGLIASYNTQLTQWWRINANINVIRLYLKGETFGNPIHREVYTGRASVFNQFTISSKWKGELMVFYRHRDLQGQTTTKPRWRMNMAILYEFMDGKAQLRVFADDIFRSWIEDGNTQNLHNSAVYFRRINETRMTGLSFSWRFGSKNAKEHRDTNEESKRL